MSDKGLEAFIIGRSPQIARVRAQIAKLAPTPLPVLIQGPTGCGKELVAEALHRLSGRTGEFVAFNVCAINQELFESALFGHARGAFTGASADLKGYLLEANGGTVFLDEVSGLSHSMQIKLLRVLETKTFRPVGGRHDVHSDFRLVSASNESLEELVEAGRMRRDLAQRLAGTRILVPSLDSRRSDIPILANHFARLASGTIGIAGRIEPEGVQMLASLDWAGGVRQLRHVVETAIALSEDGAIRAGSIAAVLDQSTEAAPLPGRSAERALLCRTLVACDWNVSAAGRRLGMHRATMYRKMHRLGIERPHDLERFVNGESTIESSRAFAAGHSDRPIVGENRLTIG